MKFMKCSKSSSKRKVHSNKYPPQTKTSQTNNYTPQRTKKKQLKPKVC